MVADPPDHRSFSQLSTWLRCQHQYLLSRVHQVPETPAVYLAAGSAVHHLLELINREHYAALQDDRGSESDA